MDRPAGLVGPIRALGARAADESIPTYTPPRHAPPRALREGEPPQIPSASPRHRPGDVVEAAATLDRLAAGVAAAEQSAVDRERREEARMQPSEIRERFEQLCLREALTVAALAERLGVPKQQARDAVSILARNGALKRVDDGSGIDRHGSALYASVLAETAMDRTSPGDEEVDEAVAGAESAIPTPRAAEAEEPDLDAAFAELEQALGPRRPILEYVGLKRRTLQRLAALVHPEIAGVLEAIDHDYARLTEQRP